MAMNSSAIKVIALFVGVGLFFGVIFGVTYLLGDDTPLLSPLLIASYGISGVIFGFRWPNMGWRLGLWLFAVWPPMLLFALFLGGDAIVEGPVDWKGMLRDLMGCLMIMVAACLGAEIGAIIKRHRMADSSSAH